MEGKEAIIRIKEHRDIHFKNEFPRAMKITEALNMAIEALEKQIPTKPTHEASLQKCFTCPRCKNVIDEFEQFGENKVRVKHNYCHFCGQKLDWD